ncbi:MAG: DUF975 family protein [Candidatus Faecousia sp.]|nr:DUF975 family protein [Candidatus Faecousia sp.]
MNIPSAKYLKTKAANRLASGKDPQRVILVYSSIVALSALAVNLIQYFLQGQISQTGGLQNIGTRSMLSTFSSSLSVIQTLVLMCLGLGYTAAILRLVRRQYASEKTLKAGFERFWVLLRARLLMMLIYGGIAFALTYLAMVIYMLTPLSSQLTTLVLPIVSSGSFSPEALLNDEVLLFSVYQAIMPMLIIYCLLLIPAIWAISYRFRLVDYLLIDQPQLGAMAAMRTSNQKMKGNVKQLFKLDFSFWWYYLLRALSMSLVYLDLVLAIVGIELPLSSLAQFVLVIVLYLGSDFALNYFFLNRVEATYALFYDLLNPQQPPQEGAILGNIFQI